MTAEALALLDCAEDGVTKLLAETLNVTTAAFPVKFLVDNKSLVNTLYSTKAVEDKYLLCSQNKTSTPYHVYGLLVNLPMC